MNECNLTEVSIQWEVSKEFENMDKYLSELSDRLWTLQSKILPILWDINCDWCEKESDVRLERCQLAEELESNNCRIQSKIDFVNQLIRRIQL
jgi:hypothetical protein